MSQWRWEDFLLWNTLEPVLSCIHQNCGGEEDDIRSLEEYFSLAKEQLSVYQVAYAKNRWRYGSKHHESFNVQDANRLAYFHTQAAFDFRYPVEFYQVLYQKPEYYVDFKGRNPEFEQHIIENLNWINTTLYPKAFEARDNGQSFDAAIEAMVYRRFSWVDEEMQGILSGYLKQKPLRVLFLIDIEPVNDENPDHIFSDPKFYFHWLEPAYENITQALKALGIEYISVVSGKGYHIITSIPLWENGQYNSAMLNLMEIGGILQSETVARMVHTYYGSRKTFPVPLLSEKAHQGVYKLMQYLLVNLTDGIQYKMQQWGLPPLVSFCDDDSFLVSLDMTAMLNPIDRRDFGIAGQIYGKTHKHNIVRIMRERSGYDFFGKGFARNDEVLERMFSTRTNLDLAKAHIINTGARIPDASSSGFNSLISQYLKSNIKQLHDEVEHPIDEQEIQHFIRSNYEDVRQFCPNVIQFLDDYDSVVFLNPKTLSYFYQELEKSGFDISDQLHITYALYHDSEKNVDIPDKYCRALWAKWPVLLKGSRYKD